MIDELLPEAFAGERLDRVVAMLGGCSRATAASLVADGCVFVDGVAETQRSARVEAGMRVAFDRPVVIAAEIHADPTIEVPIVYADQDLIVVDKPAGLVVHPGAGRPDGTLVNALIVRYPEITGVGDPGRPGIVHRLDGDTTGLLVVARSEAAYRGLVEALSERRVERIYTAIVHGMVADDRGVVDAPIGRSTQRRSRMAVAADGREARTHYTVDARRLLEPEATQLTCRLETGRTHQIRVHLAAIGHAVVGDRTYGPRRPRIDFDRTALHARELAFDHPVTKTPLRFAADLPLDLAGLVQRLGLAN